MKLFNSDNFEAFNRNRGRYITDIDAEDFQYVSDLFLRFTAFCKVIEKKLSQENFTFCYPDKIQHDDYKAILPSKWSMNISSSQQPENTFFGYSVTLSEKLCINLEFLNRNIELDGPSNRTYSKTVHAFIQPDSISINDHSLFRRITDILTLLRNNSRFLAEIYTKPSSNMKYILDINSSSLSTDILFKGLIPTSDKDDLRRLTYERIHVLVESMRNSLSLKNFEEDIQADNSEIKPNEKKTKSYQKRIKIARLIEVPPGPVKRPIPKTKKSGKLIYPRDPNISFSALCQAEYKCEADSSHKIHLNDLSQKPDMEAHHLIPMSQQYKFQISLDVVENIICLCPNCHTLIHRATVDEKKKLIVKLFKERMTKFPERGIFITLLDLLKLYKIPII